MPSATALVGTTLPLSAFETAPVEQCAVRAIVWIVGLPACSRSIRRWSANGCRPVSSSVDIP